MCWVIRLDVATGLESLATVRSSMSASGAACATRHHLHCTGCRRWCRTCHVTAGVIARMQERPRDLPCVSVCHGAKQAPTRCGPRRIRNLSQMRGAGCARSSPVTLPQRQQRLQQHVQRQARPQRQQPKPKLQLQLQPQPQLQPQMQPQRLQARRVPRQQVRVGTRLHIIPRRHGVWQLHCWHVIQCHAR